MLCYVTKYDKVFLFQILKFQLWIFVLNMSIQIKAYFTTYLVSSQFQLAKYAFYWLAYCTRNIVIPEIGPWILLNQLIFILLILL
jgi:hypothetical protein